MIGDSRLSFNFPFYTYLQKPHTDMRLNRVIKFNLEDRAIELRAEGKGIRDVAKVLSEESGEKISSSSVQRFLNQRNDAAAEVVAKNEELAARVAEAEINTIEKRQAIIQELIEIARESKKGKNYRDAVSGLGKAIDALDSLDKRTGKLESKQKIEHSGSVDHTGVQIYLPDNGRDN